MLNVRSMHLQLNKRAMLFRGVYILGSTNMLARQPWVCGVTEAMMWALGEPGLGPGTVASGIYTDSFVGALGIALSYKTEWCRTGVAQDVDEA